MTPQPLFQTGQITVNTALPLVGAQRLRGLGVNELFPEGCVTNLNAEEYTEKLEEENLDGGEDSTLSHKKFVARVTSTVDEMRNAAETSERQKRPLATMSDIAAHWNVSTKELSSIMEWVGVDDVEDSLTMLAGQTRPPNDETESPSTGDVEWQPIYDELVDFMIPTRTYARKLRTEQEVPLWAANGISIAQLFAEGKLFRSSEFPDGVNGEVMLRAHIDKAVSSCQVDGEYAFARQGKNSRRVGRMDTVVFPSCDADLSELGRKFYWDLDWSSKRCTPSKIADVPLADLKKDGKYHGPVLNVAYINEQLPHWKDEQIMQDAEYGLQFESELGHGVVICPMNNSARPHLLKLWKGVEDQIHNNEVSADEDVVRFPSYFYPYGAASPNWRCKWRLTNDLRVHGFDSEWARMVSRNDNCQKEDYTVPDWVRLGEVLKEGESLRRLWHAISAVHPESRNYLRPCAWAEDGKGYFHIFGMRRRDRVFQGMLVPTPDGPPRFVSSHVLLFGSVPGPWWAQRFSCVLVGLIRKRILDFEMTLLEKADEENPVALRLMPKHLAALIRNTFNRGERKLPHWFVSMFIDDVHGKSLGTLRAIAGLLITWDEMKRAGVPIGKEDDGTSKKSQLGEITEFLGTKCYWALGGHKITERKTYIMIRWMERVIRRTWIHATEFESLWGTIGNVAGVRKEVRRALGHGYKAKASSHYVIPSKYGQIIRVSAWLRDSLRTILISIRSNKLAPMYESRSERVGRPIIISTTDAARTVSEDVFSGIGGVILFQDLAAMWVKRLDMEELEQFDIHVTELWADLIGVHLIQNFMTVAGIENEESMTDCLERVDNMGVVQSITAGMAKDIRLSAMLALRAKRLSEIKIRSEAEWISTDDPEQFGDAMSRGRFDEVRAALEARGFKQFMFWDLNRGESNLVPDMANLRSLLMNLSSQHKSMKTAKPVSVCSKRGKRRRRTKGA